MVPFDLEIELDSEQVKMFAEQLERFADIDGYTRYDVRIGERRSVIYVNVADEEPFRYAYDDDEVFNSNECKRIGQAVRQFNRETKVVFAQFLLDF